jgi:hypothetical protein
MHDSGYFGVNTTFTSYEFLCSTWPKIVTLVWQRERVKVR